MQMGHITDHILLLQNKNSVDGCKMYKKSTEIPLFLRKVLTIVLTLNFINDPFPQMKDEQTDNL